MLSYCPAIKPAEAAGEKLSSLLAEYAARPVLLLVSGGSAFSLLDYVDGAVLSSAVTLGMIDDRFTEQSSVNNAEQLKLLPFFTRATKRGVQFLDTTVIPGETLTDYTNRYEQSLKLWLTTHPDGVVLVTLGLGIDGHTAGILPGSEQVFSGSTHLVTGYEVSPEINQFTTRLTVTPYFLKTYVIAGVVYVVGEEKFPILQTVLDSSESFNVVPAIIWHDVRELVLVTDLLELPPGC